MKLTSNTIHSRIQLLKESRLELLRLHKLLVDRERENLEIQNGEISNGHYLNLLVNDSNFKWLRKFSTLIAEIDEMLDLDDGYTINMIDKYFLQMRNLLDAETTDENFNNKFKNILQVNSEVVEKRKEIVKLIFE